MCKTREDHGWSCACVRAQTHGDGIINYSVAFTLACNGVLMHIGTALSWVCARAPRIRLRCFSRDAVDPLTRVKLRARANFTWNIIVPVFKPFECSLQRMILVILALSAFGPFVSRLISFFLIVLSLLPTVSLFYIRNFNFSPLCLVSWWIERLGYSWCKECFLVLKRGKLCS